MVAQTSATPLISHLKSSRSKKEDPKCHLKDLKMPDAQSDVHLRGRDVSQLHITTHSGSAQDCLAERCSDGCCLQSMQTSATPLIYLMKSSRSEQEDPKCHLKECYDARVTHVAKANTPSSNRQKAAYTAGAVRTSQSSTKNRRRKRKRANLKRTKQDEELFDIELPDSHSICTNIQSERRILFVDGGIITNPPICPKPPMTDINNNQTVIVIPACVFKIPRATIYYSTIKFHYQNMHLGLGIV